MPRAVLSDLEASFVEEYIRDYNGTAAAKRAGFDGTYGSRAQWATKTLKKNHIQVAIDKAKRQRAERCKVSLDQIVGEHIRTYMDPDCPHPSRTPALREVARLCGLDSGGTDDLAAALQRVAQGLKTE